MNERQLALVKAVDEFWFDAIGTHWADCYRYHTSCLSARLLDLEEIPDIEYEGLDA